MPLKYAVKSLEEVEEAQRPLYVEDKEVGFRLAVDGLPVEDPAELRRAKQRESEARKAAEAEIKRLKDEQAARDEEIRKAAEEAAKKSGDIDALQKSWTEKHSKEMAELEAKYKPTIESLESDVTREMIDRHAQQIASDIALPGSDSVLYPHIRARLRVEMRDGRRTTIVVDPEGKASAMTLADLKKEFVANKAFSPLLRGSRASGGGANGGRGNGGDDSKTVTRSQLAAVDPMDRAAFLKGKTLVDDAAA